MTQAELIAQLSDAELTLVQRELRRQSFHAWVRAVMPGFVEYRHALTLIRVLSRVGKGDLKRVIIAMPPRLGKSLLASRLLPSWWLYRYPETEVGLASYGADTSSLLSFDARRYYLEGDGVLDPASRAVGHWRTTAGGAMWAAGIGGAMTGKGAELAIIDDAHKNREEADSETKRRRVIEWYRSTFYTRLHPGAALVVIGTRWHEGDLIGWLLEREDGESPEGWHVVLLDHEHDPETRASLPKTCTVEPDWREAGELLAPDRYEAKEVAKIKAALGGREWSALHQQRPMPREGDFFRHAWMNFVDHAPAQVVRRLRYWDLAGTEGAGDYTAGVLMSRSDNPAVWTIEDSVRGQWSPGHRLRRIQKTAFNDGSRVTQWFERDPGIGGRERTQQIIAGIAPLNARSESVTGSKEHRAEGLSAQMESGNINIVKGGWNDAFVEELLGFPAGKHDDQVDGVSGAFNKLQKSRASVIVAPWAQAR